MCIAAVTINSAQSATVFRQHRRRLCELSAIFDSFDKSSAPPDFAELLAGVGAADLPPRATELVAAQFDTVAAAAAESDAPVANGVMPTGVWR